MYISLTIYIKREKAISNLGYVCIYVSPSVTKYNGLLTLFCGNGTNTQKVIRFDKKLGKLFST